jgi:hypothetical protein
MPCFHVPKPAGNEWLNDEFIAQQMGIRKEESEQSVDLKAEIHVFS